MRELREQCEDTFGEIKLGNGEDRFPCGCYTGSGVGRGRTSWGSRLFGTLDLPGHLDFAGHGKPERVLSRGTTLLLNFFFVKFVINKRI